MPISFFKSSSESSLNFAYYRPKTFPCLLCKHSYGEVYKSGKSNLLCRQERKENYTCFEEEDKVELEKVIRKERISQNRIRMITSTVGEEYR